MKKIIFICHGNICRSPAAEFIAKDHLKRMGKENDYEIISLATSLEEIGNDIYYPMQEELKRRNISFAHRQARRITQLDYDTADYIFYMDNNNLNYLNRLLINHKHIVYPINKWNDNISYIEDPWYTGNYKKVCTQIEECILNIFKNI